MSLLHSSRLFSFVAVRLVLVFAVVVGVFVGIVFAFVRLVVMLCFGLVILAGGDGVDGASLCVSEGWEYTKSGIYETSRFKGTSAEFCDLVKKKKEI